MAFGDCSHDTALREAWHRFCDALRHAGDWMFQDSFPTSPLERAEAFRYLTRTIPVGLAFHMENVTPMHPALMHYYDPTRKQAGDNSDALYYGAWIDGSQTYRISGTRGSAHWMAFTVLRRGGPAGWQEPYALSLDAEALDVRTLQVGDDGSIEVWLSPEPHDGNWIRTTSDTVALRIRQFFGDWNAESPATLAIERVGGPDLGPLPSLEPEQVIARLDTVGAFVRDSAAFWPDGLAGSHVPKLPPNEFFVTMPDPEAIKAAGVDANPGGMFAHCLWSLAPDEALVIEFEPPEAYFWSFQNETPWLTSFDYRWRLTGWNCKQATLEEDGTVLAVVSTVDPGVPNWFDTAGFTAGNITYRGILTEGPPPVFRTRVVPRAHLPEALGNATRIDAAGRAEQLRLRAEGVRRRFRM